MTTMAEVKVTRGRTLYESHTPDRWAGTQADGAYENTSTMKPVGQPPCETLQFAQETEYLRVTRDKYGNEWPVDRPQHMDPTPGQGASGSRMFADGSDSAGSKPDDFAGFNVIEYGQGAGFPNGATSTVWADVSRADRGKES